jgi:hypothetical protein
LVSRNAMVIRSWKHWKEENNLNSSKIHSVICSTLYDIVTTYCPLDYISMSSELLQYKYRYKEWAFTILVITDNF